MAAHSWKTEAFDACTKLGQALSLQPEGRSRCAQASVRVASPGAPAPGRPGFQRRTVTAHRQTPRLAGPVTRGAQRQRRDPRLLVRAGHRQDPRRQHGVVRRRQARYPHYPDRLVMDFGNLEGGGVQRVVGVLAGRGPGADELRSPGHHSGHRRRDPGDARGIPPAPAEMLERVGIKDPLRQGLPAPVPGWDAPARDDRGGTGQRAVAG